MLEIIAGVAFGGLFIFLAGAFCYKYLYSFLLACIGFVFIFLVVISVSKETRNGEPITSINGGEYEVAFIHVVGDNVSLGIEKRGPGEEDLEKLYFYQFPIDVFDGNQVNRDGTILKVIENNGFKKLRLD